MTKEGFKGKDLVADAIVNLLPSLQLIQAIEKTGRSPHIIYISSGGAVYGSTLDHHPSKEEDPCPPSLIYGIQKLAIEHYLRAAAEKGILRATILRVANAYGALLAPLRMQGLIGTAVSRATMGLPLRLLGNPENIRDYVHVSDVAQALVLALKNPAPVDIFNIGSGKKTSVMEILALIRKVSGSDLPIQSEELPENQTLPDCCLLDISKAEQKNWAGGRSFILKKGFVQCSVTKINLISNGYFGAFVARSGRLLENTMKKIFY